MSEVPEHLRQMPEYGQLLTHDLLWDYFARRIAPAEVPVLRSIIGESVIAENEQLFEELVAHLDILYSFRQENDVKESMVSHTKRTFDTEHVRAERDLLRQNIVKSLNSLQDLSALSERDRQIADVLRAASLSARSCSPADHPFSSEVRPSSRSSSSRGSSANSNSLDSVRSSIAAHSNMNVNSIDSILDMVREALRTEEANLREDVEFVVGSLESEISRKSMIDLEPSVRELRDVEKKLSDLESAEQLYSTLSSVSTASRGNKLKPLAPVASSSSASSSTGNATSSLADPNRKKPSVTNRLRTTVQETRR